MPTFDAETLMLVIAVFNGFMVLVWVLLGRVFQIAPQTSLLLAAAHLVFVPGFYCPSCSAPWPEALGPWMLAQPLLFGLCLISLGVNRLMRLRSKARWLVGVTGLTSLAGLALNALGSREAGLFVNSLGCGLLALQTTQDVWTGRDTELPRPVTLFLILPYALLTLLLLSEALALIVLPGQPLWVPNGELPKASVAWLYLFISLCIGVGLVGLLVGRLVKRVNHISLRDPLTGALNRRAFEAALQNLQAQVDRGHSHCLIMLDVDHFKQVNETLGHAGGDAALQHLTKILNANMRTLDQLARLGGEEFCLLLAHTPLREGLRVAERMAQALRASPVQWRGQHLNMTASFGVAPCLRHDPLGERSLAQADALLYRAKADGRNRVYVQPSENESENEGLAPSELATRHAQQPSAEGV